MAQFPAGYKFPILNSDGTYSSTVVDIADMFVRKELFLNAGLFTWGFNNFGQLGNGTTVYYSSPIQVGALTNWKQVFISNVNPNMSFLTSVKTDGTLWACGYNGNGQLGNATTTQYSSPIQIGTLTNWKQVACGSQSTAAIKTDGTLWVCGYNNAGQLGNGTTNKYSSPIQVGSLTNWKQVACGYKHTAAIKTDGTLWTWGSDGYGQLGNGTTVRYSSPIQIGALTNWKQVACGTNSSISYTAAVKTDGTLWTWGSDGYGQLGNGSTSAYSSPIQVGSLTNWKQVACDVWTTFAIKTDGTLWGFGGGNYGILGNGTSGINYSSPIQIGTLNNWKQVACGYFNVSAIKTDGTLWTWGFNTYGQLGNNTYGIHYSSPIQVGSLTNWKQVSSKGAISSPDLP